MKKSIGIHIIFCLIIVLMSGCAEGLPADNAAQASINYGAEEGKEAMETITAWDAVNEMKIGWNLGNTMDATNSSLVRTMKAEKWETAWGNPVTSKEMITTIIDAGFNVIRIPVSWNDHIYVNDNYRIEESWMDRVQEIVDYAYDQGAYVILNTHHEAWYYPYYDNQERASQMLSAVWAQIGERFKDYDYHLIFEGMNEPRKVGTAVEWNGGDEEGWDVVNHLNQVFVDTIRQSGGNNQNRFLMVTGYAASCWGALPHLEVPKDENIIVSVHAYEPYDFALNVQGRGLWNQDTDNIDTLLKSIDDLFISKGIPVIIGEFGAMYKAEDGNEKERGEWARYYVSKAAQLNVPCIWWDNGAFSGEGELFGLLDRESLNWKYPLVLQGLLTGCGLSAEGISIEGASGEGNTGGSISGEGIVDLEAGIASRGNLSRLKEAMKKAERGEEITIGFLGGSITQGSLSSTPETCYAYLVYDWWQKKFPDAKVNYQNAGIGGTTSQFGAARVESDLLAYEPDVIITEFAVNDENTLFFKETHEGLLRKMLKAESEPAVILLHNVVYNTGHNAQEQHSLTGWNYSLPGLSMKSSLYPKVEDGTIPIRQVTPDDLHPNDEGHEWIAKVVTYFLEEVYAERDQVEEAPYGRDDLPSPVTKNAYENAVRYQNYNTAPILQGFAADTEKQQALTDIFKNGWTASRVGDSVSFEIQGSELAIQYRKSVTHPACVARAVIDGKEDEAIILDGNFDQTWGDCLYLETVLSRGENTVHTIEITITEAPEGAVPFYLVSVIGSY